MNNSINHLNKNLYKDNFPQFSYYFNLKIDTIVIEGIFITIDFQCNEMDKKIVILKAGFNEWVKRNIYPHQPLNQDIYYHQNQTE